MTPLPDTFRHDGFDFRLIKRTGAVALLSKSKPAGHVSYEVVRLVRVAEREMFGRTIPAHEAMPASEQWGERGWTYCDREQAEKKFSELTGTDSTGTGMPRITHDEGRKGRPFEVEAVVAP